MGFSYWWHSLIVDGVMIRNFHWRRSEYQSDQLKPMSGAEYVLLQFSLGVCSRQFIQVRLLSPSSQSNVVPNVAGDCNEILYQVVP